MIKQYCDVCGKEIDWEAYFDYKDENKKDPKNVDTEVSYYTESKRIEGKFDRIFLDLCADCRKDLNDYVRGYLLRKGVHVSELKTSEDGPLWA